MTPFFFLIIVLAAVSVPAAFAVFYEEITAIDITYQISKMDDDLQTVQFVDTITQTSDTNILLAYSSEYKLVDEISGTHELLVTFSTGSITGVVFEDINGNGIQDSGETGIMGYTMHAIDLQDGTKRTAMTGTDGMYRFDMIPPSPEVTLVQAGYFPAGHTVVDPNSSWFTYAEPFAGSTATFDLGFHPVTPEEQVTLEIHAYGDSNGNGQRDPGESGIGDVFFIIYTYTIGQVSHPQTNASGVAITANLVPADFAVLVDVDQLRESGYIWTSTNYERYDDTVGKQYDPAVPVANEPDPGSRHVMEIGLQAWQM